MQTAKEDAAGGLMCMGQAPVVYDDDGERDRLVSDDSEEEEDKPAQEEKKPTVRKPLDSTSPIAKAAKKFASIVHRSPELRTFLYNLTYLTCRQLVHIHMHNRPATITPAVLEYAMRKNRKMYPHLFQTLDNKKW